MRLALYNKKLDLRLELDQSLEDCGHIVFSDSKRIKQILFNLVGNAVKFTTEGSIVVYVSKIDPIIDIGSLEEVKQSDLMRIGE